MVAAATGDLAVAAESYAQTLHNVLHPAIATVTIIEQGVTKTVDIPLIVLPEPVKAPVVSPVSKKEDNY